MIRPTLTTAHLRSAAYDAEHVTRDYALAARLYAAAADRYPEHRADSEMARADLAHLRSSAARNLSLSKQR